MSEQFELKLAVYTRRQTSSAGIDIHATESVPYPGRRVRALCGADTFWRSYRVVSVSVELAERMRAMPNTCRRCAQIIEKGKRGRSVPSELP